MAEFESKLVPILRDGVDIMKMILFKDLKSRLSARFPDRDASDIGRLCAALLNELFGTPSDDAAFADYVRENRLLIDTELAAIPTEMESLKIPLTDTLRVQFLCDSQEGIDSAEILTRAYELKILIKDRPVPLPKTFLNLVRKLGVAHGILAPESIPDDPPE